MSESMMFFLSTHVVMGILGIACFAAVGLALLKKNIKPSSLKAASLWGLVLILASWASGGYYYWAYYGKAVRAVIKSGPYPWAHTVFMESKEHIFLFLPFLALAIVAVIWSRGEGIQDSANLKRQIALLAGMIVLLGIFITLSGAVISGAVRT